MQEITSSPILLDSSSVPLSAEETLRLRQLEAIVDEGLDSFLKVGAALTELRDRRLYRSTHARWSDFCLDKWGLSLSRCNQVIQATLTYTNLVTAVPQDAELLANSNEHMLRPISQLEPELQVATWELIRHIEERPSGTTIQETVIAIKDAIAAGWDSEQKANSTKARVEIRSRIMTFLWAAMVPFLRTGLELLRGRMVNSALSLAGPIESTPGIRQESRQQTTNWFSNVI
jgi:hypothetical protein